MARRLERRLTGNGPNDLRRHNRALIVRTIRERPGVSRAELTRLSGLSGPAVSLIVNELLGAVLVREDGHGVSTGGRRATSLRIAECSRHVLAVDLARHYVRVAVTDLNAAILYHVTVPPEDILDPQANLRWLTGLLEEVLVAHGAPRADLLGIGVGGPGPLRTRTGEILAPTYFGHWKHLPLRSALEAHFGVPVRVDNDANACALAQRWLGAGRDVLDFVYVVADSGVGAGVVLNGDVYRGAHDLAAEIGHTTIDIHGPTCPCGNIGCLELYTTLRATLARWIGTAQPITPADEVEGITTLIAAARAGDETARAALTMTAQYLAVGVVNAINAYDPQVVFIGRELAAAGDMLLGPIREAVARRAFTATGRSVPIELDPLGQDTPLLGAACLILCELFDDTELLDSLVRGQSALNSDGHLLHAASASV